MANLKIHLHKINGVVTTFVQEDLAEIRRMLENLKPHEVFARDRLVITEQNTMTSVPVSNITRIDLITEGLPQSNFPSDVAEAVELSPSEYSILVRNPTIHKQWQQLGGEENTLVTFLDLELADGQQLLLTTELQVTPPAVLNADGDWFPHDRTSLSFRMRAGGIGIVNLSNLVRLTCFPNASELLPDAWHASQMPSQALIRASAAPPPVPFGLIPKKSNSRPVEYQK